MQVILPSTVSDSVLVSTTVPEADFPVWNPATSYVIGNKVIRTTTHKIYESLTGGVDASLPEDSTAGPTPKWLDLGYTNRWALFDDEVGSLTTATTSMTYVLSPGLFSGVSLLELTAEQVQVIVRDGPGGVTLYDKTYLLDGSLIDGFYSWFFEPYSGLTSLSITDLPIGYWTPELEIIISGTGTVACGVLKLGSLIQLGATQYGASLGIISYSRKETNAFGRVTIVPRRFAKKLDVKLMSDNSNLTRIYDTLAKLKDTPCVWIGSNCAGFESLTLYGFYKDFSIDVAYPTINYCTLSVEGLI